MGFELKIDGMAEISEQLTKLETEAPAIAAKSLYEGAGVMADSMQKGVATIRTAPFQYARDGQTRMPSPEEKAIVEQAAVGIAKFDKNGTEVNTSVGFRNAGYAMLAGKRVPIPKVVNAINSGTSFMKRQPFVRKAVNSGKAKAVQAITDTILAEVDAMNKK